MQKARTNTVGEGFSGKTKFLKNSDSSLAPPEQARPGKFGKNRVCGENLYGLWLTASGARRMRVQWITSTVDPLSLMRSLLPHWWPLLHTWACLHVFGFCPGEISEIIIFMGVDQNFGNDWLRRFTLSGPSFNKNVQTREGKSELEN